MFLLAYGAALFFQKCSKSAIFRQRRIFYDNNKNMTNFNPTTLSNTGLAKTLQWFSNKNNLAKYKIPICNV